MRLPRPADSRCVCVGCGLRTVHTGELEHEWVRGELGERPAQGGFVWLAPKNVQKELGSWGCSSRSRATDTVTSSPSPTGGHPGLWG